MHCFWREFVCLATSAAIGANSDVLTRKQHAACTSYPRPRPACRAIGKPPARTANYPPNCIGTVSVEMNRIRLFHFVF
ncbi:MAG: hypothetical protein QOI13_2156 [Paraburkholderia sp.]|nr:hypothetical protein [Paraburkholderia sp.]